MAQVEGRVTQSTAVLAVADLMATAAFYRDVLGFEIAWTWGEPPTFGCVKRDNAEIFFCQQPDIAARVEGHQHWFRVDDADVIYDCHRRRSANIIDPIADKPWGVREYVVRDPNGYHLRFAGPQKYQRPPTARDTMPDYVRIDARLPSIDEYNRLNDLMGWDKNHATVAAALAGSLCGVVAIDTRDGKVIGTARAVGDGERFIYIQDVMVLPDFQHQKIGSAIMESLMADLRNRFPKGASVYLFTGKPEFYQPFGFKADPYGMSTAL